MSPRSRPVRLSVRVRILATLLIVAGLGMAVAGSTAYLVQRDRVLTSVDERLVALAGDAAEVAADSGSAASATLDTVMTDVVQRVRPGSNESALGIVDGRPALSPGGTVAFRLDRDQQLVDRVVSETADGEVVRGTLATPGERALRYIAVPIASPSVPGQADARTAVFVIAVDVASELAPLTDAFTTYAAIAALALAVVGVVGWFVAGRLLRPIRSLTAAATRITASDLAERIPVTGRDDISQLTVTVNGMLDRLEVALTAQRQLLDDVGHELKTPVTIVRGHLELMDAGDPLDVATTRELAIDELDRMSGLVSDIARLAEAGRPGALVRAPVDVAELTDRIRAKAVALADRQWVIVERAEGVGVLDADRITQAMLQLAANAVSHGSATSAGGAAATVTGTGGAGSAGGAGSKGMAGSTGEAGGRIELGSNWAADASGDLRLWVRDFGPGVPPDARVRVFERFQRGPEHGRGSGGSGLGLAIVSSIAEAHGGRVELEAPVDGGALFRIVIPAAEGREGSA
ncbi:MAG: HAMP domain-containing histidine kinase [Herbiconiux sp.]|uniref:sensor histidine kinase n=1 Tax=Herbiconiux sp. TaxID=1871186 RepID=UPI001208317A|nr:HAMP domain-containing sensor histidine kinase [Herbiconiux sp.]TAJ47047.1 MAG: HAMP domain-containing histidine kinase [Herbiconiux sp.]